MDLNESLSQWIELKIASYFQHLDGTDATNLYTLIQQEVDLGVLRAVLKQTNGNQSMAAKILGMSRVTLKKKLETLSVQIEEVIS